MRFYTMLLCIGLAWPAAAINSEHNNLVSMPRDIVACIVVDLSTEYSITTLINLFTSCKILYGFLSDEKSSEFWQQIALFNCQHMNDTYIFNKFKMALEKHQYSLARLFLGYGGIQLKNHPQLLCNASTLGDIKTVNWLLTCNAPVNAHIEGGKSALHCAAEHGQVDIMKRLKEADADFHQKRDDGCTPITALIKDGSQNPFHILIKL